MKEITTIIYFSAALQGVILATALLFKRKSKESQNITLGLLVLFFSLYLFEFASYWTDIYIRAPHLLFLTSSFPFLFGPLFYHYLLHLQKNKRIKFRISLLHFIPFFLSAIRLIPFYIQNEEQKREMFKKLFYTADPDYSTSFFVIMGILIIQLSAYFIASWRLIHSVNSLASRNRNDSLFHFDRTKLFLYSWGLFIFLRLIHILEIALFKYEYIFEIDHGLLLFSSLVIYFSSYGVMRSGAVVYSQNGSNGKKYAKSSLSESRSRKIAEKLKFLMEEESLYKNTELTLSSMADRLSTSEHHLSQVLNERFNKNFYDLVNYYRVEEVKKMLLDPSYSHLNLLGVALDSGFNTKASFNTAFKKFTGMTPSEYQRKNIISISK